MEILPGDIDGAAVAQVSAVGEGHAQHGVAGLEQGEERREVRAGAGVGLYVGKAAAEQLTRPPPRQFLHLVHRVTAAVIPFAGVALRVFIRKAGTHRQHDRLTHQIFRRDQFNIPVLPVQFLLHRRPQFRVGLRDIVHSLPHKHRASLLFCNPVVYQFKSGIIADVRRRFQ